MYGAIPYLMRRFQLDRDAAFRVVCDWVDAQDAAELAVAARATVHPRLPERTAGCSQARAEAKSRKRLAHGTALAFWEAAVSPVPNSRVL